MEDLSTKMKEPISGLTTRSFIAIIYAVVIFAPSLIWFYLSTGNLISGAIQYTTILLCVEIAMLAGTPLRKQEVFLIWSMTRVVGPILLIEQLLYASYYRRSPAATIFSISHLVPDWYAPPPTSQAILHRNLLHPDFLGPIVVPVLAFLFHVLTEVSMGFITYTIFVQVEKLPFPTAQIASEAIITMSERDDRKMFLFIMGTIIAVAYSIIVYGFPLVTGYTLIPIPWVDLNRFVEPFFPGASLGVATDLTVLTLGMMIPIRASVAMLVGSLSFYFFGNWLTSPMGPETPLKGLFYEWTPGMSVSLAFTRSSILLWISTVLGLALASGLLPIIRHPKKFLAAFRTLAKLSGLAGAKGILALYFFGSAGTVGLTHYLIPSFPLWLLILFVCCWSFIGTIIATRGQAEIGMPIEVPYVTQGIYLVSGYQGVDIWFAPSPATTGGQVWCWLFKIADLTESKPIDFVKAYLLFIPIGLGVSLLYTYAFWRMAPIPSAQYPITLVTWPVSAYYQSMWATRSLEILKPILVLGGFVTGVVVFTVSELIPFIALPLVSFTSGAGSPPPTPVTVLLGGLIGKALASKLGAQWWRDNRAVIIAGILLGQGITTVIGVSISLITRSLWTLPY